MEEEAVSFLLQKTAPHHEIRAAFAPPRLTGWVYLEATMNKQLRSLLNLMPGIVHTRLDCQRITHEDGMKLLQMRQFSPPEYVRNWVQVRKGLYKGDVGYVQSAESWGIRLFLIPRLLPPQDTTVSRPKENTLASVLSLHYSTPNISNSATMLRLTASWRMCIPLKATHSSMDLSSSCTTFIRFRPLFRPCLWFCSTLFGKANIRNC